MNFGLPKTRGCVPWSKLLEGTKIIVYFIYHSKISAHIESAENHIQVNQLCLHLKTINHLKISSYNWSEAKGLIIMVSLKDVIPLGDVLRQMPLVDQVYKKKKKDITVVLNSFSEMKTPALSVVEDITAV